MKQFILKNRKALTGIATVLLIGGVTISFQDSGLFNQKFNDHDLVTDTVPERKENGHMKMKDFDKIDAQLDKALSDVHVQLKNIDFAEIEKTVQASLKTIDMEKIMKDVELSLKDLDIEKIVAEATSSLKDIDWKVKEKEVSKALKEAKIEMEKAREEIKNINTDEVKKELNDAKKEIEKSRKELQNIDMDKIMKEARNGINVAREEMKLLKTMFIEMEKDGLVNTKTGFTIEYKDKELFIDGKKQPEQVTDKYRKYIKDDHFKMTIDKE